MTALADGYRAAFWVAAALTGIALVAVLALLRPSLRATAASPPTESAHAEPARTMRDPASA